MSYLQQLNKLVKECFKRISIYSMNYVGFLADFESTVDDISNHISEYNNIDEPNYLGCKLEELSMMKLKSTKLLSIFVGIFNPLLI